MAIAVSALGNPQSQSSAPQGIMPLAEQRVLVQGVSWEGYEQIIAALGDCASVRLHYYKGFLEIMTPSQAHEGPSSHIDQFVNVVTEESDRPLKSLQSTRLKRAELVAGAEPDQCYYIANEPLVRGKSIDLNVDPPPDLVVEVDITNTDLDKAALYADLGVPEFWRYDGEVLRIYQLETGSYQEVAASPTFPTVPKASLYQFLQDCTLLGETQAKRMLRSRLNGGVL